MPRKPSYDFERREREKAKALKTAERAKAKAEKKSGGGAEAGEVTEGAGDLDEPPVGTPAARPES